MSDKRLYIEKFEYNEFLQFRIPNICMSITYLIMPREKCIYISQGRYDPLIKDEREKRSSTLIHLADSKTGETCRGVSSQLSTLRGNVAYYFSQLHQ